MATIRKTTSKSKSTTAKTATSAKAKAPVTAAKPAEKPVTSSATATATAAAAAAAAAVTTPSPAADTTSDAPSNLAGVTRPAVVAVTKKILLERVAARANVRKNQARPIMDAILEELGESLVRGETLKLPPMGVMKVNRQKDLEMANIVVCKLRRKKVVKGDDDPLAEAAE